jgi:hypothetical protein
MSLINCSDPNYSSKYPSTYNSCKYNSNITTNNCSNSCSSHIKNIYNQCINPCTNNVIYCQSNPPNLPKIIDKNGAQIYILDKICDYEFSTGQNEWLIDLNNICNYGCVNLFTLGFTGSPPLPPGTTLNINLSNVNYYCNNIGDWFIIKNLTYPDVILRVNFNSTNILHTITDPQFVDIDYLEYQKFSLYKTETNSSTHIRTNYWMTI